jgi:translation elongation factor EF-1alpha
MDDKTVNWSVERYTFIKSTLSKYLKKNGFKNVKYIPVSGLVGDNLITKSKNLDWYYNNEGKTFIEELDDVPLNKSINKDITLLTVFDKIQQNGFTKIMVKVEEGILRKGDNMIIYPTNKNIVIDRFHSDFDKEPLEYAIKGDLITIYTKKVNINDINSGDTICKGDVIKPCNRFISKIQIMDTSESCQLITKGTKLIMHLGTLTIEVEIDKILTVFIKKEKVRKPFLKKGWSGKVILKTEYNICCSTYKKYKCLSTFALREGYKTIAIGRIEKKSKHKN